MHYIINRDKNRLHIEDLCYLFYMPLLIDLINVIVNQFGIGSDSKFTMLVYMFSLIFLFLRNRKCVCKRDFRLIVFVAAFIIGNYALFPENRAYMKGVDMLLIYLFYFPVCIFSIRKIRNWDMLIPTLRRYGIVAVFTALFILSFLNYKEYLVYMGFSYALLPFIAAFYVCFRCEKNPIDLLLFLLGLICVLIFGARAVILFMAFYIIVFEIMHHNSLTKVVSVVILSGIAFTLYLNMDDVVVGLIRMPIFSSSYFLQNYSNGVMFESATRVLLYGDCISRIQSMGLGVSGFFGDREYCIDWPYPHNFFFEVLMQWGWIIGIMMIIGIISLLVRCAVLKDPTKRDIAIFMIITGLARYIISGSYLVEGKFWILLTIMIALVKSGKKNLSTCAVSDIGTNKV